MAILTFRQIIIDLSDQPQYPVLRETSFPSYSLHFVNLGSWDEPTFEVRDGQLPPYRLTVDENDELTRLMQDLTFDVPSTPMIAFDGRASELSIRQHGSDISFRWYIELPVEWASIGKLFAYAASFHNESGAHVWANAQ